MSNIVLLHQSPIINHGEFQAPAFYEGLIDELIHAGNNVFHVITNDILLKPWAGSNTVYSGRVKEDIHSRISAFNPDIVISFNNSSVEGIETLVDCPILLWNADSVKYFNDLNIVRQNIERYYFLAVSDYSVEEYTEILSPPSNKIHRVRFATAIKPEKREQIYNVSFIGSRFKIPEQIRHFLSSYPEIGKKLLEYAQAHNLAEVEQYIKTTLRQNSLIKAEHIKDIRSGQDRMQILSAIAPLGLTLFGDMEWQKSFDYSLETYMGFDPSIVYNLEQNSAIYNRSKIGISISHAQNVTAYPWRVVDIMASNAVLVSDKKSDLINDFAETVPLQLYETPYEAYEITKRLLSEKKLREDIVKASQASIDAGFRWKHRLNQIQDITKITLLAPDKQKGRYTRYLPPSAIWQKSAEKAIESFFSPPKKRSPSKLGNISTKKMVLHMLPQTLKQLVYKQYAKNNSKRPMYKAD